MKEGKGIEGVEPRYTRPPTQIVFATLEMWNHRNYSNCDGCLTAELSLSLNAKCNRWVVMKYYPRYFYRSVNYVNTNVIWIAQSSWKNLIDCSCSNFPYFSRLWPMANFVTFPAVELSSDINLSHGNWPENQVLRITIKSKFSELNGQLRIQVWIS
jgi:hypothetical protein